MSNGILYGIGVGPGDPELMTVKGARILASMAHVFVPKAKAAAQSRAFDIARSYLKGASEIHELVFPMTSDRAELARRWAESAEEVAAVLKAGHDCCFLTLGSPLLYSTYIYLVRALRTIIPDADVVTVPGITAVSAAAALTEFPLGEGSEPITILPAADDPKEIRRAIERGGTVVLMKIGKRLQAVLRVLEETGTIHQSVFVSRAGMEGQKV